MDTLKFKPRRVNCIDCDAELYVNENEGEFDVFALFKCPKCNYQCITLRCPYCDNVDFLDDFTNNPTSWICKKCEREFNFSDDFYTKQNHCYKRNGLPEDAIQYLIEEEKKELFFKRVNKLIILFVAILIVAFLGYSYFSSINHK